MFPSRARRERTEQARAAALRARDAAADAFLGLDETQQMTAALVTAYTQVEPGPAATRVSNEVAPLLSAADRATATYLRLTDGYAALLTAENPDLIQLANAEREMDESAGELAEAEQRLTHFRARHADLQERLSAVQARVGPATAAANAALDRARAAALQARNAGIVSRDLDAKAARALELGRVVSEGAFRAGAQAALDAAAGLSQAAEDVVTTAQRLVEVKTSASGRLASTRTRLEGIEGRVPVVNDTLSYLRRTYSMGCSADLDHVPDTARAEVEAARGLLARLPGVQGSGDWDQAAALLDQARAHLQKAEDGINGVVARRRDLDGLAADPAAEREKVRFAVHDAQRLVVSAGAKAPAAEAGILDGLMTRIDAAEAKLRGVHPDYWSYLVELRAIREVTAGVVRRTRAAIAG